jgi:hypothetical protein
MQETETTIQRISGGLGRAKQNEVTVGPIIDAVLLDVRTRIKRLNTAPVLLATHEAGTRVLVKRLRDFNPSA